MVFHVWFLDTSADLVPSKGFRQEECPLIACSDEYRIVHGMFEQLPDELKDKFVIGSIHFAYDDGNGIQRDPYIEVSGHSLFSRLRLTSRSLDQLWIKVNGSSVLFNELLQSQPLFVGWGTDLIGSAFETYHHGYLPTRRHSLKDDHFLLVSNRDT